MQTLQIELPGLRRGEPLPNDYADGLSQGRNQSLPLQVREVPDDARSVALALIDVDARDFVHWLVVDLPPGDLSLPPGVSGQRMPLGARELYNTAGRLGYFGPNPPHGSGPHRYTAIAYALDVSTLDVDERATFEHFRRVADKHALATGKNYWTFENR